MVEYNIQNGDGDTMRDSISSKDEAVEVATELALELDRPMDVRKNTDGFVGKVITSVLPR